MTCGNTDRSSSIAAGCFCARLFPQCFSARDNVGALGA